MTAMLRRLPIHPKATDPANPIDSDGDPRASKTLEPIGVSMKFQYGSGDTPLDGYKIKRGVGAGGFGEVYFAESDAGKEVALKRIQKNLEVEVRGVRHCLNLRHPNLVAIYDIKFDKLEQGWIVMEFIDGDSMRDRMDRFPQGMSVADSIQYFTQLAAGVAYLHDQGIVHRDLKPANVFIDGGLIKIGDYGLSKYISASRRGGQTESVGTFHYMAPEIGKGEYGKEIDIYSLGIILYELLTGNVPFDGESSQEIILKHLTADPDVSNVPQPMAGVIQKALAKNPTSRFRDCREMLDALGWRLDPSGLAVKRSSGDELPPVLFPEQPSLPVARLIGNLDETTTGPSGRANTDSTVNENPWHYRYGKRHPASAEVKYREPVAQFVHESLIDFKSHFKDLPPGGRAVAIGILVLVLVTGSGVITPMLMFMLMCYACYYVVWYLSGGAIEINPNKNKPARSSASAPALTPRALRPQPRAQYVNAPAPTLPKPAAYKPPVPYRVALKNWQTEQRSQLKNQGFWSRLHAYTRGWAFSGIVTIVLALSAGLLTVARELHNSHALVTGIAWTAAMSLLITWTVLFLSRRWEKNQEDSIVFRFVQMSAGVVLGVASFAISDFLMVPWTEVSTNQSINIFNQPEMWNRSWKGFYDERGTPLLAGHIAYFGALMWIVRWWRQSDILRKSRFSTWSIAWSVAMAGLVQGLFYFPTPWCFVLAGVTSFTLQMASPWLDHKENPQLA